MKARNQQTSTKYLERVVPQYSPKKIRLAFTRVALLVATITSGVAQSKYEPYTFTTLAGGGGFSGPDLPGNAARFQGPAGIAVDNSGNVYVMENGNQIIRKMTPAGEVTTLAGRAGSPGIANGLGNAARFHDALGVAVDSSGNAYVADTANNTIRKVTSSGSVTTLAGQAGSFGSANGMGNAARFWYPNGVAVDGTGNVYVADTGNNTIRKITPTGVVTTLAGRAGSPGSTDGTGSAARFDFPSAVAADSAGNVYVADSNNHTIRKVTLEGVVTTLAGVAGTSGATDGEGRAARFNGPGGIAVDSAGNIYVPDVANHTIRRMTPVGTNWVVTTLAGLAESPGSVDGTGSEARFNVPVAAAVESTGKIYVADLFNGIIRKITPDGTNWVVTTVAGVGGINGSADGIGSAALFKGPSGVAVDNAGNTYVMDQISHTLRKVTSAGVVTTLAGRPGYAGNANGTGVEARFNGPLGVAVDSATNIYVADTGNSTIRKVTPAGVVTTLAGSPGNVGGADGTGSEAQFAGPNGLAVDKAGNIYVADSLFYTLRKITPGGVVTTLAGSADVPGSANGLGNVARFNTPTGVALDSAGNVYVADSFNQIIRKVTPVGTSWVVTTLAGLTGSSGSVDGMGSAARFYFPTGVAVDGAGHLYVSDTYNNTIRKLTQIGTNWVVTTLGGMVGFYGAADGVGSAARFSNPDGVAVDSAGDLYVADFYFNTIRKGSSASNILISGPAFGFRDGLFGFGISAVAGKSVVIEATVDLTHWLPIETNIVTAGLQIRDPQSLDGSHRFYRFRLP